jgi:hypothetical protein
MKCIFSKYDKANVTQHLSGITTVTERMRSRWEQQAMKDVTQKEGRPWNVTEAQLQKDKR